MRLKSLILTSAIALSALSHSYTFAQVNGSVHSAVIDTSNVTWSSTNYAVYFGRTASEDPLYINQVSFIPGENWDSDIEMNLYYGYYGYTDGVFGQAEYQLGEPLTGDLDWTFGSLATRYSGFLGPVDEGIHDFQLGIYGGDSSTANDTLAVFDLQLHVIQGFNVQVTASFSNPLLQVLDQTDASVTVTNNGTEPFVTSTWYVGGFGLGSPYTGQSNQLTFVDFLGDWFNKTILAGESRTDLHSRWEYKPSNEPGLYYSDIGIIGGLYDGDSHHWQAEQGTLQVGPAKVSGTVEMGDYVGSLESLGIIIEVWQDGSLQETILDTLDANGGFAINPETEGEVELRFDFLAGLDRVITVDMDNAPIEDLEVFIQNGDVDHSGEVDAVDIDQVIAEFGSIGDAPADVNGSEEVDAVDIDIVIANFGGVDD